MYKERWWVCKVHQVNAGRTWGGSSYPRNVGSAAAASLATPPANFSASKTSTLKFISSNIYNICTQAHWSVRFCQGWKVNGVWKSLKLSHTKFYLPHQIILKVKGWVQMGKGMTPSQICIAVLPSTRWIPPSLKFAQICWLARCALQLLCRDLHPAKWYKNLKEGFKGSERCFFYLCKHLTWTWVWKISFAFANRNCYIVSWEQIVWAASKRTRTISRGIFFWEILMSIFTTKMCLLVGAIVSEEQNWSQRLLNFVYFCHTSWWY